MEGFNTDAIKRHLIGKRAVVHTHRDFEGMEGVVESANETGVVLRSGTQKHEIAYECIEPAKKTLKKWEVKDFEDWYATKMKDWENYYKQFKKEIVNKKEVIQSEFLSYLGILERKVTRSEMQKMNLSVADLYIFCVEVLKSKVAT